jgi:hypothetical protein
MSRFRSAPLSPSSSGGILGFALLAALASPGAVQAQTVDLGFGWTPGMSARVSVESLTSTEAMGQTVEVTMRSSHTVAVTEVAQGLGIESSDFELELSESSMGPVPADVSQLQASHPSMLVSRDGTFVDLLDAEGQAARAAEAAGQLPPEMAGMLDNLFDADGMRNTAREQWRGSVGWWVGRSLTVGQVESMTIEQNLPIGAGATLAVDVEIEVAGVVDCLPGSGAGDCVELIARATPTEESLQVAMDAVLAQLSEQMGDMAANMALNEFGLTTETVLVAEPGTLVPHRSESTVEQTMSMAMMGMAQEVWTVVTTTTEYDWSGR